MGAESSSSSLYWLSARKLLTAAVLETDRARVIVEARANIERVTAESYEAVANGDVDKDGKVLKVDGKKKKKELRAGKDGLLESRESADIGMLGDIVRGHNDVAVRYNENAAWLSVEVSRALFGCL